jgi:MraZ protein
MDEKGRVFVAKRIQALLGTDPQGNAWAVITRGLDGCLFVYDVARFERLRAQVNTREFESAELRLLQREFFGRADYVQLDSAGRVLIGERLRALAGLEKDVVLLGAGERAELWDKTALEAYRRKHEGAFERRASGLVAPPAGGAERP